MQIKADNAKGQRPGRKPAATGAPAASPELNGQGQLQEPDFDTTRFYEMLQALSTDFIVANFTEDKLRDLCGAMIETLDRAQKRLQHLENQRNAQLCTYCKKPFPSGRHVGEIVIRSEITNELEALRACSEPCYREISRLANERRQKNQGSYRGSVAI